MQSTLAFCFSPGKQKFHSAATRVHRITSQKFCFSNFRLCSPPLPPRSYSLLEQWPVSINEIREGRIKKKERKKRRKEAAP